MKEGLIPAPSTRLDDGVDRARWTGAGDVEGDGRGSEHELECKRYGCTCLKRVASHVMWYEGVENPMRCPTDAGLIESEGHCFVSECRDLLERHILHGYGV